MATKHKPAPQKRGPKPGANNNPDGRPLKGDTKLEYVISTRVDKETYDALLPYGKTWAERLGKAIDALLGDRRNKDAE